MLDVLHYYFEEDTFYPTPQHQEARSATREHVYGVLYGTSYVYALKKQKPGEFIDYSLPEYDPEDDVAPINQFSVRDTPAKPFVPATEFNEDSVLPFGNNLDAPLR